MVTKVIAGVVGNAVVTGLDFNMRNASVIRDWTTRGVKLVIGTADFIWGSAAVAGVPCVVGATGAIEGGSAGATFCSTDLAGG